MTGVRRDLFIGVSFLIAAMFLTSLALAFQAQAREGEDDSVSADTSLGLKLRGDGTVDDEQPSIGGTLELLTQTQSGVKLRGDGTVDDSQSGTVASPQTGVVKLRGDSTVDDTQPSVLDKGGSRGQAVGQERATERRSAVANFVQKLKEVADRQPGVIGDQIRIVAAEQDAAGDRIAKVMGKVEKRSKIKTFLFGSDYKNLGSLRSEMVQTRNRLRQLNQIMENLDNEADKTEIKNQIQALEQERLKIENFITAQESKISLFGWLAKLLQ
jgi:hypothetical protein